MFLIYLYTHICMFNAATFPMIYLHPKQSNKLFLCYSVIKQQIVSIIQYSVFVTQLCLTLFHLVDCSPLGSSVRRIPQARILKEFALNKSFHIFQHVLLSFLPFLFLLLFFLFLRKAGFIMAITYFIVLWSENITWSI